MSKIEENVLEKLYGKKVSTQTIQFQDKEFFGDNKKHSMSFDVYDGFAYCEDYKGREYVLSYPKLDFITSIKQMENAVREFMGLNDTDKICVTDVLQSYCHVAVI